MTTYQGVLHFHSETGTEGGAWAFQDAHFMNLPPDGMWSYEGLHVLEEGSHLTVYGDHDEVLFKGMVKLPPRQDPYADDAYAAGGYYAAHRRPPEGADEAWWFEERKATLTA